MPSHPFSVFASVFFYNFILTCHTFVLVISFILLPPPPTCSCKQFVVSQECFCSTRFPIVPPFSPPPAFYFSSGFPRPPPTFFKSQSRVVFSEFPGCPVVPRVPSLLGFTIPKQGAAFQYLIYQMDPINLNFPRNRPPLSSLTPLFTRNCAPCNSFHKSALSRIPFFLSPHFPELVSPRLFFTYLFSFSLLPLRGFFFFF